MSQTSPIRLRRHVLGSVLVLAIATTAHADPIDLEGPLQQNVCGAYTGGALASTCNFTADAGGTPTSARTDFVDEWDSLGYDGLTLALHELFHAIGFTANYDNFADNLYATPGAGANGIPDGSRVYSTDGTVGGILMTLTPSDLATHADPDATGAAPWPATGYDQSDDLMQPFLPLNTVRLPSDALWAVLDDAFGWGTTGITIFIHNLGGSHSDADLELLAAAAGIITDHYGSFGNSPTFDWYVAEVAPEPSLLILISLGGLATLRARRRRA